MSLLAGLLSAAVWAAPTQPQAIYMVLVDRFANGDPDNDEDADPADPIAFHGGDLAGVRAHLDPIQALGFTHIWLSPIAKMRTEPIGEHGAFHGYWLADGRTLEPRFGTRQDLLDLDRQLQRRNMGLYLDAVTNHVGPGTALTQAHPEWFHRLGDIVDWSDPAQLITHDVHGLPDLAQERPAVKAHLIEEGLHWLERVQLAGLRLDAVRHLPPGFVLEYGAAMRAAGGPEFSLLGEIFEGNPVRLGRQTAAYGLSHSFDFPLHYALIDVFCRGGDVRAVAAVLAADQAYPEEHTHLTFLDNHDLPRIRTACGGDEERVGAAMALLLTLRGTPVVTYGTEAGLQGSTETEARSDMVFDRRAPVAQVIGDGLRRRRNHPQLATAPTLVEAATKDSLTLWRPGEKAGIRVHFSRAEGVRIEEAPPRKTAPPPTKLIHFQVPRVALADGETLWLSGSLPVVGSWNPERAVGPLVPGSTHTLPLAQGAVLSHKLLIRTAEGGIRWSPGPNQYTLSTLDPDHPRTPREQTRDMTWPAP